MDPATPTAIARLHLRLHREAVRRHALAINAAVAIGGALGALARFGLLETLPHRAGEWPWATFAANLIGALLLGIVAARLMESRPPSAYRGPLLATGLCGALTTFSTFQVEALSLADGGHAGLAIAYVGTSIALGLVCVAMGSRLTHAWSAR